MTKTEAFTLYSDFNCPFCYAFGEHLLTLGAELSVTWRGVQHAPHLTIPMATASAALADELEREVAAIRALAPSVPIAIPSGKPNTGPAIIAVASAMRVDPVRAHRFKSELYRALWIRGTDISDRTVLADLAREAGIETLAPAEEDALTASHWQRAWMQSGARGVPALFREDGRALVGLAEPKVLRAFLEGEGVGVRAA